MSVNKYKILRPTTDQHIDIPIEIKWDFYGRDDSIDEYQEKMVKEVIGSANDFEIDRFVHNEYNEIGVEKTSINYEFNFYGGVPANVATSTISDWVCSYLTEGFTSNEIYYYYPFIRCFVFL